MTGSTFLLGQTFGFGGTPEPTLQIGAKGSISTSGGTANASQECVPLPFPSPCTHLVQEDSPIAPVLWDFWVDDVDNADAVMSVGDVFHVTFNVDTDRGGCTTPFCGGGITYIQRLFTFEAPLAANYTGEWADAKTFLITVLHAHIPLHLSAITHHKTSGSQPTPLRGR